MLGRPLDTFAAAVVLAAATISTLAIVPMLWPEAALTSRLHPDACFKDEGKDHRQALGPSSKGLLHLNSTFPLEA